MLRLLCVLTVCCIGCTQPTDEFLAEYESYKVPSSMFTKEWEAVNHVTATASVYATDFYIVPLDILQERIQDPDSGGTLQGVCYYRPNRLSCYEILLTPVPKKGRCALIEGVDSGMRWHQVFFHEMFHGLGFGHDTPERKIEMDKAINEALTYYEQKGYCEGQL